MDVIVAINQIKLQLLFAEWFGAKRSDYHSTEKYLKYITFQLRVSVLNFSNSHSQCAPKFQPKIEFAFWLESNFKLHK